MKKMLCEYKYTFYLTEVSKFFLMYMFLSPYPLQFLCSFHHVFEAFIA
jgi:hypothetical protein